MIFTSGLDFGHAVDGEWNGFNILVSPKPVPIPSSENGINYHLQRGAIMVYLLREPDLFGNANNNLFRQKRYLSQINQRLLLLTANGEQREMYQKPARDWIMAGGVSHILPEVSDVESWLKKMESGIELQEPSLAEWLSHLPGISPGSAKKMAKEWGGKVMELFSISTLEDQVKILDLPGFEGISLGQLQDIRSFLQLGNKELRLIEPTKEQLSERRLTHEFHELAEELGGKVVVEE